MKPRGFSRIKKLKKSYSSKSISAHVKNLGERSGSKIRLIVKKKHR